MGHKIYGDEEPRRSRAAEFCENFFAAFMAFSGCIGGWLVHFGMSLWWMAMFSLAVAAWFGWALSRR